MKIAIPTRNHLVDDHFGHCEYYTIFTLSENNEIICTETQASPEGCGCKSDIAAVLEQKGVRLMLAGNMGQGAKQVLESHHIQVIRGCSGPVESVLKDWIAGKITDSGESCSHHEEGHECHGHSTSATLSFKVITEKK